MMYFAHLLLDLVLLIFVNIFCQKRQFLIFTIFLEPCNRVYLFMVKINPANNNKISFGSAKPIELGNRLTKFFTRLPEVISTPQQRMIVGGSALILHPIIDLNNKKVDKRTRETSASRSMSRAIVGTVSGIAVRAFCNNAGDKLSKSKNPAFAIDALKNASSEQLKRYGVVLGSILSLLALSVTNFIFDVPLINKYQNLINEKVFHNKPNDENGGLNEQG